MGKPIWATTITLHNYRSRKVHETVNGVNPSSGFRDMRSSKWGPICGKFLAAWQALMWHICGNCNETTICTEKHEIQNVCKTVAILGQPQWLDWKIVICEDRKTAWTKQCHNHCTLINVGGWCRISTRCAGTWWRSYWSVFPVRRWRCSMKKKAVRRKQLTFETVIQSPLPILQLLNIDELMQKRSNSSVIAVKLHLLCIKASMWRYIIWNFKLKQGFNTLSNICCPDSQTNYCTCVALF